MRKLAFLAAAAILAAAPALTQTSYAASTSSDSGSSIYGSTSTYPGSEMGSRTRQRATGRRTASTDLDRGPMTPDANRAYMGGGVILQGAPGGPPPMPEPTPPGQTPRNMVPLP